MTGTSSSTPAVFDSVLSSDMLSGLVPAAAAIAAVAAAAIPVHAQVTDALEPAAKQRKASTTAAVGSVWHLVTTQALAKRPDRPAFAGRPF
jgi:hypothetical protein